MGKTKVEIQKIQVNKLCFFQMQASSDPVSLQSVVSLSCALFGCNFTKNTHVRFNTRSFLRRWSIGNAVVKLRYGGYNGNTL